MEWDSLTQMANEAEREGISLGRLLYQTEAEENDGDLAGTYERMARNWQVMKESVEEALKSTRRSRSGMIGGDGQRLLKYTGEKTTLSGRLLEAVGRALAVAELNAAMGLIVAAPTAGSAGILPGVLTVLAEELDKNEEEMVLSLFCAAGVGLIIAQKASLSGAEGGCQAECGSAAAMAAAAAVELAGGTPTQALAAIAISMKNSLGLVCDPVAGLVEVPCAKRNALGAANAMVAADLALAGISSVIPADEVIEAMGGIGRTMPSSLRETAQGGLAQTPTGRELAVKVLNMI